MNEKCEKCKKWRTARCGERKSSGRDSGPDDWCYGFKMKKPVSNDGALRHVTVPSPPEVAVTAGIPSVRR